MASRFTSTIFVVFRPFSQRWFDPRAIFGAALEALGARYV